MRVKLVDDDTRIVVNVLELTNANALAVSLVDSSGTQITSFGGGTQYTEAATDTTITGTAIMWEDTADTLRAVSAAKPLPVTVISGGTSGTEYTEGDTDASITGTAIMWEDTADTLRAVSAAKPLPVGDAGGTLTIDNATLSVVGGGVEATALRVTIASDSTGVLSVDDNGGALTVDNGGTFAVQATIAAGATNIAKAEDVAFAGGDVGVPAMAIQLATPADTAADGDYAMLQMSAGRLWASVKIDTAIPAGNNNIGDVDVASSALPTGASTLAEQQTQTTALSAIQTAVQIMDDWDETDRAKVNPIVGQAGVQGGSGTVSALTQRVVLATDVGLPAGTAALGSVNRTVASTATLTSVNDTASSTTIISANASRRGATIFNDSTEVLYIKFGATASTTSFTYRLIANATLELPEPMYVGVVDGIWAADGSGAARITEIT